MFRLTWVVVGGGDMTKEEGDGGFRVVGDDSDCGGLTVT